MKRLLIFASILAMSVSVSACAAPLLQPPEIASATSTTSLCLVDQTIPVQVAPGEAVNDTANLFDTDETVGHVLEHNARYRAACPGPE